jgi:hypothetical protein
MGKIGTGARVTLDGCLGAVNSLINKHGNSAMVAAEPSP